MRKPLAYLSAAFAAAAIGSLIAPPHALAYRQRDEGGIGGAEGRYSVVFSLDQARPNSRTRPGGSNLLFIKPTSTRPSASAATRGPCGRPRTTRNG